MKLIYEESSENLLNLNQTNEVTLTTFFYVQFIGHTFL